MGVVLVVAEQLPPDPHNALGRNSARPAQQLRPVVGTTARHHQLLLEPFWRRRLPTNAAPGQRSYVTRLPMPDPSAVVAPLLPLLLLLLLLPLLKQHAQHWPQHFRQTPFRPRPGDLDDSLILYCICFHITRIKKAHKVLVGQAKISVRSLWSGYTCLSCVPMWFWVSSFYSHSCVS